MRSRVSAIELEDRIHMRYGFDADHIRKEVDDWLRWQG